MYSISLLHFKQLKKFTTITVNVHIVSPRSQMSPHSYSLSVLVMKQFCIEAKKLYQRDPKIKREDVKILQQWLKKQPHLPQLEESQIIIFLHSCYYSIQSTKKTIDYYFTARTLHPELFHYPTDDVIKRACSIGFKNFLPKKTPEGYTVFFSGLLDYSTDNYNYNNEVLLTNLLHSLRIHQHGFSDGLIVVSDCQGGTLGHLARVNFASQKCMLDFMQEGTPLRLKGFHMINAVPFLDKVMAMIKPLISAELFKMIHIHPTLDSLYEYVPKECLPKDYGGELPSRLMLQKEMEKTVFDNVDFFKWHDSQIVDESKRIEKSKIVHMASGLEGTFKKLEID